MLNTERSKKPTWWSPGKGWARTEFLLQGWKDDEMDLRTGVGAVVKQVAGAGVFIS